MSGARTPRPRPVTQTACPAKKDAGFNAVKHRELGGYALEMIMRDVLEGLQEFTRKVNLECRSGRVEILGIENGHSKKMPSARILYFPRRSPLN